MFFTLSKEPDYRFPFTDRFGDYYFSHDSGWSFVNQTWSKGYHYPLLNHGNFLKIRKLSNSEIVLEHDNTRGFPLWWDNNTGTLTNLLGSGIQIWSDRAINIKNHCLDDKSVLTYNFDSAGSISFDNAVDCICENLVAKAEQLKNDQACLLPKKMFLTGGIDTAMIYSVLKYANVEFELVDYEYIKYDWFLNKNLIDIKNTHWGYGQIHHWDQPTILITGSCGDEYLMRSPTTVSLYATWHDINLVELIKNNVDLYHAEYFFKEKNLAIFNQDWKEKSNIKEKYQTFADLAKQIVNINCNDFQVWHLGNTVTWTPLKDIELLKICMRLELNDLITHFQHATLNREVIQKLHPPAINFVSKFKNSNNMREVFNKNINR
jgi:hypothetical protein